MWFKKLSLKAAAVVLAGFASSAFSQALAPLQITADDWNYLSNFKLFGQTGLSFGNQDEFPNEAGWVGTATGDLYSTGNNGKVGGAVIVGGTIHPHSNMQFTTGPIRYGTGFTSGVYNGSVRCDGLTTSGSCKDVPLYRTNLKVPSAGTISGMTQSVPDRSDLKIEMPYKGSYDIYFSSLSLGAEAALIIELPDKKHAARLFINKLNVNNHPMFLVKYKNENGYRCIAPDNKFQLSGRQAECVGDYEGNLVVYVNHSIKFGNTDNYPMDGTFIFNGTAEFVSNFMFSGQIFAKELKLGSDINGKNFKFVKYVDPPKIILSQRNATFKEGTSWYEIGIGLDSDEGEKDVTFDYCFEFQGSDIPGKFAIPADVDVSGTGHDFPICGKATGHVTIPKGKTVAQNDANRIFIKPIIDGFVEESSDGEKLWLKVTNVQGAEVSSVNYDAAHGFNVFITDVDKLPSVSSSLVINVNEDDKHSFTKAEFKFEHNVVDRPKEDFKSVIITGLPSAGSLTLNGSAVTRDQEIAVGSLGKLVYTPKADEFGNNYATFKYKVVRTGAGDDASIQSKENTATVNVIPVNDKPSVADAYFSVNELDKTVSGGPITVSDVTISKGKELGVDTYSYTLVNVSGSDYAAFNSTFEIVPSTSDKGATATIKVKSGATLDYAQKKEYVVYATVKDNAATETSVVNGPLTSGQFKITVKIQNENDDPVIANQTFTIAEKQADGSDWPSGKTVGNVTATDPDGDDLSFSVVTTGIPFKFKNGTKELVVADGSVLDFETKPTWTFTVKVEDGQGGDATAQITVNLTDVNEQIDPPVIKNEYTVNENTDEHSAVVSIGSFEVFDQDAGDVLTYTLTGALPTGLTTTAKNLSEIFVLKETKNTNGTRTVSINVKDAALLDYEALYSTSKGNATYQATITITDKASHKVTKTTNIAVKDVNEKVSAKGGSFYLNEHSPIGSPVCAEEYKDDKGIPLDCKTVARVEGSDLDIFNASFSTLTYEIIKSKNTGMDYSLFTVNKNTGVLYTSEEFDYETQKHVFEFVVTVSDGEFTADAKVVVNLDDIKEPEISYDYDGDVTVREDAQKDDQIVDFNDILEELKAKDAKVKEDLNKIVGKTKYTVDQDASANASGIFDITAGMVKVKDPAKLDFESLYPNKLTYTVVVNASGTQANGTPITVPINLKISVTDVNEKPEIKGASSVNDPPTGVTKGDFEIFVPETWTNADDFFGKVLATDPDNAYAPISHPAGFDKLTYKIEDVIPVDGSSDFPFELDANTGKFTVIDTKKLDYTKQKQYKCVVRVVDNPSLFKDGKLVYPALSATATIVINVIDVNRPSEFRVLSDLSDTAAHVSKEFTVKLQLDTVSLPSNDFKTVKNIAEKEIARNKKPASGITSVPENGDYVKNSYTETVNGNEVTVTYYTDKKGKDVKRSVVTASGKKKDIAVIEVSYTTKVDGKDVTVSYFADASTGERVSLSTGLTDSESVLSADGEEVLGSYKVSYNYVDNNGNTVEVSYFLDEKGKIAKNSEGNVGYNVGYTYVNKFGNSSKKNVLIVLDQKGPVVKIKSPSEDDVLTANFAEVVWTVNGVEQDTLRVQGLDNGVNTIVREFRDKAGNRSRDSVHVMVKNVKNIDINVEKPVTLVDRDSVEKFYKTNPPKKDQTYGVTLYNYKHKAETEAVVGIKDKAEDGSGKEPYPGLEGHLGPTLTVDARVPVVNALGGLATLDDIVIAGGQVALEGVDADNSDKVSVSEYVKDYCTDEFIEKFSKSKDYSKMNLYWTTISFIVGVCYEKGKVYIQNRSWFFLAGIRIYCASLGSND